MTSDAGGTWVPVSLPIDPIRIAALRSSFAIEGTNRSWWNVDPDGHFSPLDAAPNVEPGQKMALPIESSRWPLGFGSIEAAVADGWPLADGIALVARDGRAFLVNTEDGSLLESRPDAYAPGPSRCRGISLASLRGDPDAFGFVCGLPRGWTAVYRWDSVRRAMVELRAFPDPRQVLAFGNGSLAVRGGCRTPMASSEDSPARAWCVMRSDGHWHDVGIPTDSGRLVVLSDGRLVVVEPPRDGDLSALRLVFTDGPRTRAVRVVVPNLPDATMEALRSGVWLDGFEERKRGVLSGWVDLAQTALGVEIALDGTLRVGEFIRDAGAPIVSGRWGFGWTASRGGFETTNGGMTWKRLELPEPLGVGTERACGPLGCVIAGWVRIGWGGAIDPVVEVNPVITSLGSLRMAPNLNLACQGVEDGSPSPNHGATAGSQGSPMVVSVRGDSRKYPRNAGIARLVTWEGATDQARSAWTWRVEWAWPWGGAATDMASSASLAPWGDATSARRALGVDGARGARLWTLVPSSTPMDAMLITQNRADNGAPQIFLLRSGSPPIEVGRSDRQLMGAFEDAKELRGRWIFATAQGSGQTSATVVWSIEEGQVRELARVPRSVLGERAPVRIATRSDGRAIGVVVESEIDAASRQSSLWVVPISLESGRLDEPERLAPARLISGGSMPLCRLEDSGWSVEVPYPGAVRLGLDGRWPRLDSPLARLRISRSGACVEGLLGGLERTPGSLSPEASSAHEPIDPRDRTTRRTIDVGALSSRGVQSLRCWPSSP